MTHSQSEARAVVAALAGKWHSGYGVCRCPAHHDTEPSLSVGTARDGRLLLCCHAGCDFGDIIAALQARGIVAGENREPIVDEAALYQAEMKEVREAKEKARRAREIWNEAGPLPGSLAETYLRSRGLSLPGRGAQIRCHPSLFHSPSGQCLPAMVALVLGAPAFAVHRTFLHPDGVGKIDIAPAKLMLGRTAGGAVIVSDPAEIPSPMLVGEGIETTLAAFELLGQQHMALAALSAANMARLTLPRTPGVLVVCADGDATGRQSADTLATRADRLGWKVSIMEAPDGQDANDMLNAQRAADALRGADHV